VACLDRDIEAALREALGPQATVSRSTVSRICETIKEQFAAWRTRELTDIAAMDLLLTATAGLVRRGQPEPSRTR
jgi:transposase-like protein